MGVRPYGLPHTQTLFVSSEADGQIVEYNLQGQLTGRKLNIPEIFKTAYPNGSFANYEGICVGPKLADGRQLLILISDSQNQYRGVLRDWFKTIVMD